MQSETPESQVADVNSEKSGRDDSDNHDDPEIDPELDALLDDALKQFNAPNSVTLKSTAANGTSSSSVNVTKDQTPINVPGSNPNPQPNSKSKADLEAEFRKLLSNEAIELGDLLANEFEKAMLDSSQEQGMFSGEGGRSKSKDDGGGGQEGGGGEYDEDELCRRMEQLTKEMEKHLTGQSPGGGVGSTAAGSTSSADPFSFEDTNNLFSEEMFKQLMSEGGEGSFDDVLQDFMETILDKEILYPSLKELNEKYGPWLDQNKQSLSSEDVSRFKKQLEIISQICEEYEKEEDCGSQEATSSSTSQTKDERVESGGDTTSGNSNNSSSKGSKKPSNRKNKQTEKIVDLMHQMRELGNPPDDLMAQIETEDGKPANFPSLFPTGSSPNCPVM